MKTIRVLLFFAISVAIAPVVVAQSTTVSPIEGYVGTPPTTVGELLDKGGKKLSKDELEKLVKGTTISGVLPSNPAWSSQKTYKDDGSLTGYNYRSSGASAQTGVTGKWQLSDAGELCIAMQEGYSMGNKIRSCTVFFSLGAAYYFAVKDDRSTPIYVREIKR
ncbi:MAG: hypothetical protein A3B99_02825 [Candidatus Yanofskybacteria bacterium RIFCSPHIGHO2_02_FULL_44_12b]|nr:MAG: hypothetical protein A3B99_02825 [Candidatus Yanofskybacteria bacterium RIFCSPHIGHO2_02_FULL_44_12b]